MRESAFERRLCRRNRFLGGGFGRGAKPPAEQKMKRALFMAKGSLFLGRMTESADGVSFIVEA